MAGLEMYGFDEWEKMMQQAVSNFPARKKRILKRLGMVYQGHVKKLCPVDTGRLRADIHCDEPTDESVEVGTNLDYAKFVDQGHNQSERFVPGYWRKKGGFQYVPMYEGGGMMLHRKFVQGEHFFHKAMLAAKPEIEAEIKQFMSDLEKELGG